MISMAKDQPISVKDAVHKLQLALLDGVQCEKQLFAAGSLISRSDYEDVVTERSIAALCGYPLCSNPPSERPRKGRYRISSTEQKVYDLNETSMFCSTLCIVNSKTFAGSLQEERCLVLKPSKLNEILRLFEGLMSDDADEGLGQKGDLGLSNLKIQENVETKAGKVTLEDWMGPSNAIEGYVPQRETLSKPSSSKNVRKTGSSANSTKPSVKKGSFFNDMDFTSTIIMNDEYNISKVGSGSRDSVCDAKFKESDWSGICKEFEDQCAVLPSASARKVSGKKSNESKSKPKAIPKDKPKVAEVPSTSNTCDNGSAMGTAEVVPTDTMLKPSLKSSSSKKQNCSVTWADDSAEGGSLCEVKEMETTKGSSQLRDSVIDGSNGDKLRFQSAEACAMALVEAAEAVASGSYDAIGAASEAGIMILPYPNDVNNEESIENGNRLEPELEPESAPLKWPKKQGSDTFDPEDSWFDAPPEGFSLTLSPFATMWNALFEWITSLSLAYIYGRDESSHEEYLVVNGREYPRKIVAIDDRSSEIKETLGGCVSRALPGLIAELRLPIPLTTLEQGMARLLDTMSFVEALPAFRAKQWQVIVLLFLDALSVYRIPAFAPHMTDRRMLLHKVLDGAHISMEEFEIMKEIIMPLGRAPQFSTQKGA